MKKTPIIFTGLPLIFNETLRRWAGIKEGKMQLEKILRETRARDYDVRFEWCALSICYFETILDTPSFSVLKENLIKKEIWSEVLKRRADFDYKKKKMVKKFLKDHISEIEKLYNPERERLWIKYARSLNIDEKIEEYLLILSGLFKGMPLSINRIIITPAFLSPPAMFKWWVVPPKLSLSQVESLKRFISGCYNHYDILEICIPIYHENKTILLPLHESGVPATNQLIFSFLIAHEISHAITMWISPVTRFFPNGIEMEMGGFSDIELDIITDAIAIKILSKTITIPKEITHYFESLDWKNILEIMDKMIKTGGKYYRLLKQIQSLEKLSLKRLRGILEKKLEYKKEVKGLTRKQLIDAISKTLSKRIETIEGNELAELQIKLKSAMQLKKTAEVLQKFNLYISDLYTVRVIRDWLREDKGKIFIW
jgi:hypothetical protein